jgi:Tol biopolymer transport system component
VLGTTAVVSVDSAGVLANATSQSPAISTDGRYVAFQSYATNLVAGDTNRCTDIFVHDRQTGVTTRISVDSAGIQANNESESPAISADGRYVAFVSRASNLIPADTNPQRDVFVHDRDTGKTTRVSVDSAGLEANHQSTSPTLSADGRYVAFVTRADNLAPGIPHSSGVVDFVVVHDRDSRETTLASVSSSGIVGDGKYPAISADGRYVAFESHSLLVPDDTGSWDDIFVHDRQTGETTRVSVVIDDTNSASDIFVHDRETAKTTRVSVSSTEIQANGSSGTTGIGLPVSPTISADGRDVSFSSSASNLVAGDTNGNVDIFVHDRGVTPLVFPVLPPDPPLTKIDTQRGLILAVHGWNANSEDWP